MQNYLLEDGTVSFLPTRLNHQPVVVRGLTADELWITVGLTGVLGLFLGIAGAFFTGQIGMAPTILIASIAIGLFVGGGMLRRQKRGRPDTWLYRHIPALGAWIGGQDLINCSGRWEIKRFASKRYTPADPKKRNSGESGKHRWKEVQK